MNLHLPEGSGVKVIDSDLFNIADRIREIDPGLYILSVDRPDGHWFVIMQPCADGEDRMALRCKELDARAVERLQYMLHVPFEQRFDEIVRQIDEDEEQQKQDSLDELYEKMGRPMWTQLEHDGFISGRNVSYPKSGPKRRG